MTGCLCSVCDAKGEREVKGLTTAASIWLAASVGMAVGAGEYILSGVVTLATILVLWIFPAIESWIDELRHTYTYEIVCHPDELSCEQLELIFKQHGLKILGNKRKKLEGKVTTEWKATGKPKAHEGLVEALLKNELIHELTY